MSKLSDAPAEIIHLWPDGPPTVIADVPPEVGYEVTAGVAKGTTFLRNISEPTMSVYRPPAEVANGLGVFVVPGGGWTINAWSHEGLDVVDWLTPLGYTTFLLKYRVQASEADQAAFDARWGMVDSGIAGTLPKSIKPTSIGSLISTAEYEHARAACADDGRRAIEIVRAEATRLGVDPSTLGMVGFSAGAFLTVDVALDPQAEQLAWVAPIYGGETRGAPVPDDAPPLFAAVAQDDILVRIVEGLVADWTAADRSAELHAYARGGHGFGMVPQGMPSDAWTTHFLTWLDDQGLGA